MVADRVRRDARRRTVARRAATALAATVVVVVAVVAAAAIARRPRTGESTNPDAARTAPTTPAVQLTGPAPTAIDLDGIWTLDDGGHLLRFAAAEGTYAIDDSGALIDNPDDAGTFSVSGNTLTFVAVDSNVCEAGQRWVWQVELLGDGRLRGIVTTDECNAGPLLEEWTWTRVSPDSRFVATPTSRPSSAETPWDVAAIRGIWLVDGGSMLLAVSTDATYAWDDQGHLDTAPADSGSVELDGSTLTLRSGADGATCAEGDTVVLDEVGFTLGQAKQQRLYATVVESTCADLPDTVSFTRVS